MRKVVLCRLWEQQQQGEERPSPGEGVHFGIRIGRLPGV
jgi:hypothetical protein